MHERQRFTMGGAREMAKRFRGLRRSPHKLTGAAAAKRLAKEYNIQAPDKSTFSRWGKQTTPEGSITKAQAAAAGKMEAADPDIELALRMWVLARSSDRICINYKLLREQALCVAKAMGKENL